MQPRRHFPERAAVTFGALRDSDLRAVNTVATGPEDIVNSRRRTQIFNDHAEPSPAAGPWDWSDLVSGHMSLPIHIEQTPYRLHYDNVHFIAQDSEFSPERFAVPRLISTASVRF